MALKRPFEDVGSTTSKFSAGPAKKIASLSSCPLRNLLNDDNDGNSAGNTKNDVSESISKTTSSSAVAASLVGFPLPGRNLSPPACGLSAFEQSQEYSVKDHEICYGTVSLNYRFCIDGS